MSTTLERVDTRPAMLAGMEPQGLVVAATDIATALKSVIDGQGLAMNMGTEQYPSMHVRIEGWLTAGAMLQTFPHVIHTEVIRNSDGVVTGCLAIAEARTLDGKAVSSATALCTRDEVQKLRRGGVRYPWADASINQMLSMAQTRASSKAMGFALRWIITLAGYKGTPAEEMTPGEPEPEARPEEPGDSERRPAEEGEEYLANDPELRDAVLPEQAPARRQRPARPRRSGPATVPATERGPEGTSGGLDKPMAWPAFFEDLGILPAQAVTIIRSELPDALGPEEGEEESWPAKGTEAEITAAAGKLQALDDQRGLAAQEMLRKITSGARKKEGKQ